MAKNIDNIISRLDQIPTLPVVSQHLMKLLDGKDVPLRKLAEVIEKDQAIAAKILKTANSSFYGILGKIGSIDNAVTLLGLDEVRGILLSISVYKFFSKDPSSFDRTRFWKHSVISSQVAKYLARHFHLRDDSLFLSGLIHDIGKIVLDQYCHQDFLRVLESVSKEKTYVRAEKEVLGITHSQVAARLLQQWKFPGKVILQVFYHHAPWAAEENRTGTALIYLADHLTKMVGYPCLENEKVGNVRAFSQSKAMVFLTSNGFDLSEKSLERLLTRIQDFIAEEGENMLRLFDPESED